MAYYEITYFDDKHAWWHPKLRRWLPLFSKQDIGGTCSHRPIGNNGREAWKIFRKEDSGAVLIKHEKRTLTEYEKKSGTYTLFRVTVC